MANSDVDVVRVKDLSTGRVYEVSKNGVDAFYDALLRAGNPVQSGASEAEASEAAAPSGIPWPKGFTVGGASTENLERDGRKYPKGSPAAYRTYNDNSVRWMVGSKAGCSKIAVKSVNTAGMLTTTSEASSKRQNTEKPGQIFSGQLIVAGEAIKCRVAKGTLRNGADGTNIHFSEDLRKVGNSKQVRKALKDNHWRFSFKLTEMNDDSESSWYLNTLLTIAQIQEQFNS
jgi:hypothetical protein